MAVATYDTSIRHTVDISVIENQKPNSHSFLSVHELRNQLKSGNSEDVLKVTYNIILLTATTYSQAMGNYQHRLKRTLQTYETSIKSLPRNFRKNFLKKTLRSADTIRESHGIIQERFNSLNEKIVSSNEDRTYDANYKRLVYSFSTQRERCEQIAEEINFLTGMNLEIGHTINESTQIRYAGIIAGLALILTIFGEYAIEERSIDNAWLISDQTVSVKVEQSQINEIKSILAKNASEQSVILINLLRQIQKNEDSVNRLTESATSLIKLVDSYIGQSVPITAENLQDISQATSELSKLNGIASDQLKLVQGLNQLQVNEFKTIKAVLEDLLNIQREVQIYFPKLDSIDKRIKELDASSDIALLIFKKE